jgi:predicted porin
MRFSGSGFSVEAELPEGTNPSDKMNLHVPSEKFEMPTYLNFGVSYDFYLDEKKLKSEDDLPKHRATAMASFTSNSFLNDYIGAGVEYAYKEMFMVRAAYRYEKDISNAETPSTFYTGLSAGATIQAPMGKNGPLLAVDYSYRPTQRPSNGVHVVSLRLMTRARDKKVDVSE